MRVASLRKGRACPSVIKYISATTSKMDSTKRRAISVLAGSCAGLASSVALNIVLIELSLNLLFSAVIAHC